MADRMFIQRNAEALRAALAEECIAPAGGAENAVRALAPQINAAAARLADRRRDRRSVRLQALALAGCSILFMAFAFLILHNWQFISTKPDRWGPLLGIGIAALCIAVCIPVLLRNEEGSN